MRQLVVVFALLIGSTVGALADAFCDGFARGYATGYMRASGTSIEPITPICPIQPIKRLNDPSSDYEHGYVIGFERGMGAGR
jgi:hypothetical protein